VLDLAAAHGVATPVARAAKASYAEAQRRGLGRLDYSAVYAARTP
jgi:3-hydroxyisobutyrate dehydrogenase-like beta-hydroxyacid dehydrogenase